MGVFIPCRSDELNAKGDVLKIKFLGTAASEGVPSMFCRCRVCENARKVKGKEIKTRAGFLVNRDLMIDFSADTNCNAIKYGVDLSAVKYLLITHTHADHFYYGDLFQRNRYNSANRTEDVLNLYGNAEVIRIYDESATDEDVIKNLKAYLVKAGERYELGEYEVFPIDSVHMTTEESLVYAIKGGGKTYFHCMDTGGLTDAAYGLIKERELAFDAVTFDFTFGTLKENYYGHNNLSGVLNSIESLKKAGAITDKTKIYACHVTHFCGNTHAELEEALKRYGIVLAYDGMEIEI